MAVLNIKLTSIGLGVNAGTTKTVTIKDEWKVIGFYPVGSLYFSINSTNPTEYFGGTWELFYPGKTIVGVNESDTSFNTVKKTGGEKTHTLSTGEIPGHWHNWAQSARGKSGSDYARLRADSYGSNKGYYTSYTGSTQAHNNLQPYRTCYIWIRTE